MVVGLVRSWARTDLVLLGSLGLLLIAGVLSPEDAFAGFANPAVIAIGALFVVAAGVDRTGALGFVDGLLRPRSASKGAAVVRLFVPTAVLSGVLNNTPVVAMLIPRIQAWARERGIPASKLLIPLSTAAIVGGWLTLIGTSTNVVVHGLMQAEGLDGFSFFDLTYIGVPAVLAVGAYYALIGHRLLPNRDGAGGAPRQDYRFELLVSPEASWLGQTVEEAGLRMLGDAFLSRIRRGDSVFGASPETPLEAGDVLEFAGDAQAHDALLARPGLLRKAPTVGDGSEADLPLFEVVVAPGSRLEGKTLKSADFRERYGGVVLAIRRRDGQVEGGLGNVFLRAGDLLLVEGKGALQNRLSVQSQDFALVAPIDTLRPITSRAPIALAILFGMIGLVAFGLLPLASAAFAAALGMVVTGCLRGPSVLRAMDGPVLLVIGAALGIGHAVEVTGLAGVAARGVELIGAWGGPVGALIAVYVVSNLLAELVTNKASAALMVPVALAVAADLGADPVGFCIAVAVGSAASFLTPIGYQTNLMVMSAGGYKYTDFTRAGAPVSLIVAVVTITVCSLVWL
ncbi:SLC13 family permease [Rubricoccus marinus]|uniref:SLC13 family permease n=2 Tax=Rubricoccus marinus TaxID=716817 RepID=A0A259U3M1_9BACT|nr:SLC13 family permease [Rubricoccus marinus]